MNKTRTPLAFTLLTCCALFSGCPTEQATSKKILTANQRARQAPWLFDIPCDQTKVQEKVRVSLLRVACLEAKAQQEIVWDEAAGIEGHYLVCEFKVSVDGVPFSKLPREQQIVVIDDSEAEIRAWKAISVNDKPVDPPPLRETNTDLRLGPLTVAAAGQRISDGPSRGDAFDGRFTSSLPDERPDWVSWVRAVVPPLKGSKIAVRLFVAHGGREISFAFDVDPKESTTRGK